MEEGFKNNAIQWLVLIIIVAVLIRLILILSVPIDFFHSTGNFEYYQRTVESLTTDLSFGSLKFIAPSFPVFLSLISAIADLNIISMRLVQLAITIFFIIGIYWLAQLFFNKKTALIAASLAGFLPHVFLQIFSLGTDFLYTTLLLYGIIFFIKATRSNKKIWLLVAAMFLVLAMWTDPIGLYVPIILGIWLSVISRKSLDKKRINFILIFIGVTMIFLSPWFYRNLTVFGKLSETPIIQKKIEIEFLRPNELKHIFFVFSPGGWPFFIKGVTRMVFIPADLYALDLGSTTSYKEAFMNRFFMKGKWELTEKQVNILIYKLLIMIIYWIILLLAALSLIKKRNRKFSLLTIFLSLYVIVTTVSIGAHAYFTNISPLSGFFFAILPFMIVAASDTIDSLTTIKKINGYGG